MITYLSLAAGLTGAAMTAFAGGAWIWQRYRLVRAVGGGWRPQRVWWGRGCAVTRPADPRPHPRVGWVLYWHRAARRSCGDTVTVYWPHTDTMTRVGAWELEPVAEEPPLGEVAVLTLVGGIHRDQQRIGGAR